MSAPLEPQYRKRIGYQAMLLGGFSTIATILLVMGNISTKDEIALRQQEDLQQSLEQVIAPERHDNNLLDDTLQIESSKGNSITIYRAIKSNKLTSLAWEISGQGYAGEMRFILSVDNQGEILGVRVLSHNETPGLGDKMELAKDDWILGFNGLSLTNTPLEKWKVKKDGGQFDAFSGATITPRGIVKAIVEALGFFGKNKNKLTDISDYMAKQIEKSKQDSNKAGSDNGKQKKVKGRQAEQAEEKTKQAEIIKQPEATGVKPVNTDKAVQPENKHTQLSVKQDIKKTAEIKASEKDEQKTTKGVSANGN